MRTENKNTLARSFLLRKLFIILLFILLQTSQETFGQTEICATEHPSPEEALELYESFNEWLAKEVITETIITIPVAFHVIRYNDGTGDVTDQQLYSQINSLNSGFSNTHFRFSLYSIDRTNNSSWMTHVYNSAEESAMKQTLTINPRYVLNFYVCALTQAWSGYARFPWEYLEDNYMHGVVVKNSLLGTQGIHEVGHYAGLYHTFYNSCNEPGDYISDTPFEANPTSGCPTDKSSCGSLDPIHNYMDYSSCRDHFTSGQSQWMDVWMFDRRNSLYNNPLLVNVTIDQKRESGSLLNSSQVGRWTGIIFSNYTIPIPQFDFFEGTTEVLRGKQDYITNPNEKYNRWVINNSSDDPDIKNHHIFNISEETATLTSQFKQTYSGVTLKNEFLEISGLNPSTDNIDFKDPWFIDYQDPVYNNNLRNRGMQTTGNDALLFRSRLSPFTPNFIDTYEYGQKYNGVFLNQSGPPLWTPPFYSIQSFPQDIYLPQTGKTHKFYWQGWSYDPVKVSFQSPFSNTSAVVFNSSDPISITANLKGAQISTQPDAYANNSQRKFVKSDDGTLHSVYESLGRVWYEYSTNNGNTWQLGNNGLPLDNGEAKQPSIDYALTHTQYEDYYQVFIVFQEKSGNNSAIKVKYFQSIGGGGNYPFHSHATLASFTGDYYTANSTPVICSYGEQTTGIGNFIVVWKRPGNQLYAQQGYVNVLDGFHLPSGANTLTGTTANSVNPTLYSSKSGGWVKKLAWEEIASGTSPSIKYASLVGSQISGSTTPSAGSGVAKNYRPSIIEYSGGARLCWKGDLMGNDMDVFTVYKNPASGGNYFYGYNTAPPSINKGNDNSFIIAWSQDNGIVNKFIDNYLSVIKTLNTSGIDIQVSNGANKNSMYGMVFKSTSTPKYFTISNSFGSFYKITEPGISSGRQGVVYKDNAEFYFMVGDVTIDGQVVDFIELPDSILFNNSEELNQYLISEPFLVNDNSAFTYSVRYGVTDSSSSVLLLNNGKQISFKLQLFDYLTGVLLGEFDEVTYNSLNVNSHNNLSCQVNTNGIGNREVVLKLVTENNFDPEYSLATRLSDENVLPKAGYKEINYNGILSVESYDLAQNFPNPFNPTTTIKYQIPEDGIVSLRIYDILGKEVRTLVNEYKTTGRYEVNFDASDLASGVYIYRIQVNDFISSKKMMFLK